MLAPLLALAAYWLALNQVGESAQSIAAALVVTVFAAVLWISEALPLPVTALLIPVALVASGVFELKTAYFAFGNPVLFLVLGGYALAVAVEANAVDRWLAGHILGLAGNRSSGLLAALMFTSALLSMLISNTATTALLLPVVLGILRQQPGDTNLSRLLLLGVAYGASLGGVATLIGSPPNAIAAGLLDISFLQWLGYGLPVSIVMLLLALPVLWWTYPPRQKQIQLRLEVGSALSPTGQRTLAVIGLTLLLWLTGPLLAPLVQLPPVLFSATTVAGMAIALLVITDCLDWKRLEQGVYWGVLVLMGGGLCLGQGLTDSGAADWLGGLLSAGAADLPGFVLLLILVGIAVFATELISNTAVTAKLAPILMGVALQLGIERESLVVPVAIATSMAFMLPVATPPNAMVHASGQISQRDMMRAGLRLNLLAILVISLLFHFLLAS